MSMDTNVVTLCGRLGADPETKYLDSGKQVTSFRVAVNGYKKDAPPKWFDVKTWGKIAEIASQYCRQGGQVIVSGYLDTEEWNDKTTGQKRSKVVIVGDRLQLLGGKKDSSDTPSQSSSGTIPGTDLSEDDIPF